MIATIIKKELRGYFNSAVAVIFLSVFIVFALFMVFWVNKFFPRGVADLRPLFQSMPVLLIILVSALAMRMWTDERATGTLELLLTLPVPRWQLVIGKFLAGLALIGVALVLTFGLPITVARMGHLDFGPVVGGYLASLLLSAAYLAIGMCVSAATNNQIVAFIGTAVLCFLAWGVGYLGDVGRLFGTGVRFESVARGVLDLRDLAYYGGIVAVGVTLNVVLLQRLTRSHGPRGHARQLAALLGVGLVLANAIALDVWLAPVRRARIDLTQDGTYSLSSSTDKVLAGLDERLLIRGYFSDKTHPKLAPLIPQLRDLLEEYKIVGGDKVRVEIIDPTDSDEAKRDAKERFGIDPTPLRFATQTEKSVINAYFAIAIEYGDQHAVLGLQDLISVKAVDVGEIEITLKNPEYQLTKTIKKTVAEFSSIDSLFASTAGKVQLTAYMTPATLPENLKDAPAKLKKVVDDLSKQAGGKLAFATVEPTTDDLRRDLFNKYGLRPYQDLMSGQTFYFYLLLQVGNHVERIQPPQGLGEAELKTAVTNAMKRAAPGFTRVVGLWSPPASPPQPSMQGMPPQQMPPPQTFNTLKQAMSGNYEVRDVQLTQPVPDDIEALVLAGPAGLDPKAAEVVDQFVMRGGSLVVLAGRYRIAAGQGLSVEKVTTGLEAVFQKWGITVGDDMVMDTKSDAFPVPQERDLGNGMRVRELQQLQYPFFVKMDGDQLSSSSMITSGLAGSVMHWGSPVKADAKVGDDAHKVDALLRSSDASWLTSSTVVEPNLQTYPKLGFAGPAKDLAADKKGSQVMAVSVVGGFATSLPKPAKPATPATPDAATKDAPRQVEHSTPDTRIVVFGSSAFVSDDVLSLAQQLESDLASSNVELVHNAVDWSMADTDLLSIRSNNAAARALILGERSPASWIQINVVIAVVGLLLVVGIVILRRRSVRPITTAKEA